MIEQLWRNSNQRIQQSVKNNNLLSFDFNENVHSNYEDEDFYTPPKKDFGLNYANKHLGFNQRLDKLLDSFNNSQQQTMLQFKSNHISDKGFVKICNFLLTNHTIQHLILSNNN